MSLRAKEATLMEPQGGALNAPIREGQLTMGALQHYRERCIPVELVQRGDIIKVTFDSHVYFLHHFSAAKMLSPYVRYYPVRRCLWMVAWCLASPPAMNLC